MPFPTAPQDEFTRSSDLQAKSPQDVAPRGLDRPSGYAFPERRRRVRVPLFLFLLTCVSTFFLGSTMWAPQVWEYSARQGDFTFVRRLILVNWREGVIYAACLLAILLTHEMGHFIATLRYRIPASFPYFLPLPISPIGTMGAVIAMDGLKANRKEIFDIGLAGPLAGLLVAAPIMWIGVQQLDLTKNDYGVYKVETPIAVDVLMEQVEPPGYRSEKYDERGYVWQQQLNPFFMAGWVGMLITGLNMLPVSQLDGGHITYALFGRRAHWIARGFMVLVMGFVIYFEQTTFILMIALVYFVIGTDHPPTSDDSVPLGWFRTLLGGASLSIPLFCFPPQVLIDFASAIY